MLATLVDLFSVLKKKNKIKLFYLQVLLLISALFEVATIITIGPFMSLVAGSAGIESSKFISLIKNLLNIKNNNDLIFVTGFITLLVFTLSAFISILTTIIHIRTPVEESAN